jgi:Na+/proline symporter
MTKLGAIAGMVAGAVTVLLWIYVLNLSGVIYEIVPGFIVATIAIVVVSRLSRDPESHVTDYYDQMTGILKTGKLPSEKA